MTRTDTQPVVHRQIRWARLGLLAVLSLYLGIATLWSVVVPLGEGPDEAAHFSYALFVAHNHRLPVQNVPDATVQGEGHQPPLAYWLLQPAVRWLPAVDQTVQVKTNPQFVWAGGSQVNAYVHGGREDPPYTGQVLAWHLARGLGVLLGAVTVALCWLTARLLAPGRPRLPVAAAALLAFNPQFIFQHALVSNDPLLIALSSLLICGCVAAVTVGRSWNDRQLLGLVLGGGLVLGLLLITKQNALALAPLPLVALGLRVRQPRRLLTLALPLVVVTAVVAGWWYLRNLRLYGDLLGIAIFRQTFAAGDFNIASLDSWRSGLWSLLRSSWAVFGWQTLTISEGAYWFFVLIVALGLIGLLRGLTTQLRPPQLHVAAVLALPVLLVLVWTVAFARTAGMVAWQGRFLFPAIVPLAIGLVWGWSALLPRDAGPLTIPVGLCCVAIALPFGLIRPAYPQYARTRAQVHIGTLYGAFDWGWRRGAELRGAVLPASATSSDTVPITLTWYAAATLDRPWSIFIHVVDGHGKVVANTSEQPLAGRFPTNAWQMNDWIEDPKHIDLTGVPAGTYTIRIGLFDPGTGERLGVYDRSRHLLGDYLVVGTLVVLPPLQQEH